jgi:hypothetical protein
MRVFKHGDALAVVIPPAVRASSKVAENDEFEFFELEPGVLVMVSKEKLASTVNEKVTAMLLKKAMASNSSGGSDGAAAARRQNSFSGPATQFVSAAELSKRQSASRATIESVLGRNGFAVMDEPAAKAAYKSLEDYLQVGEVFGGRGFDNKFYVISRDQFEPLAEKVFSRLSRGSEIVPANAAEALKEDPAKVACCLQVLKERGEALEKKRGVFVLLD